MEHRIGRAAATAVAALLTVSAPTLAGVDDFLGQSEQEQQQLEAVALAEPGVVDIELGPYYVIPRAGLVGTASTPTISGAIPVCIVMDVRPDDDQAPEPLGSSLQVWVDHDLTGCAPA